MTLTDRLLWALTKTCWLTAAATLAAVIVGADGIVDVTWRPD